MRALLTVVAAWSMTIGLVIAFGRTVSPAEWGLILFCTGAGGLAWRTAQPEPASASDLALLTTNHAVARALSREHNACRLRLEGFVLGSLLGAALLGLLL